MKYILNYLHCDYEVEFTRDFTKENKWDIHALLVYDESQFVMTDYRG